MSRTLHLFGTDWGAMMVPIQVIRWYRMQCYDGTDSCAIVVPIRRYCQQGMTSKHDTNHMGYGLWLISEFVNLANGELHMYSEGAYYVNQCGKIKKGTCGFWQGTIIYVSLPLNNVSSLQKWQDNLAELYEDIKINCI